MTGIVSVTCHICVSTIMQSREQEVLIGCSYWLPAFPEDSGWILTGEEDDGKILH